MSTVVWRVVVWFAALFILVQFLPIDAVLEALLQFSAAGVLPVVNVAMPPAITVLLLAEIGALALLLLFKRELSALANRPKRTVTTAAAQDAPVVAPLPPVIITIPGTPGLLVRASRYIAAHTPRQARRLAAYSKPRILLQLFRALYYAEWLRMWLFKHTRALRVQFIELGQWLWQLTSPHLWQFDHYLELQCRRYIGRMTRLRPVREIKLLGMGWSRSLHSLKARITSRINL